MFHGMTGHGWGMGSGWIISLIFFIVLIWLLVRFANHKKQAQVSNKTPHDILKERYAKGEIDKQEFEERKKDIV